MTRTNTRSACRCSPVIPAARWWTCHGNVQGVIVARLDDRAALLSAGSLPQNVNYALKGRLLRNF